MPFWAIFVIYTDKLQHRVASVVIISGFYYSNLQRLVYIP